MNFQLDDGQRIGQEISGGCPTVGHKGSVPAPICVAEVGTSGGERHPLMKTKTMDVPRKQGQLLECGTDSEPGQQSKSKSNDNNNKAQAAATASSAKNGSDGSGIEDQQKVKEPAAEPAQEAKADPAGAAGDQAAAAADEEQLQIDQKHKNFAKDLFHLQNKVRKEPKWIIKHLRTQIKRFQGLKLYSHTEQEFIKLSKQKQDVTVTFVQTQEGQKAYQDAISYLEKQRALPPLKWSQQLFKACKDHAIDVGPRGITQSKGSDDSMPIDRISRHGSLDQCWSWADSCIFGAINPLEALERLIVCDGQPQRGFREAIFNQDFKMCGICCNAHATHDNVIQLLYVDKISAKDPEPKEEKQAGPSDLLELAMNQDVQIVCNEAKSQVQKELSIGLNTTKIAAPLVPRSLRSPVNFKQPPKVMRSPVGTKLTTVKSAQSLAPSLSQKTLAQHTSPRCGKQSDLFDERGNLIGSDKDRFGIALKKYTEKQQQSVWFSDKKTLPQQTQRSPPKNPSVPIRDTPVKKGMPKHATGVRTMQVKLPPALREARQQQNKINNHFSPRNSPKKSTFAIKAALSQMNSPPKSASREPLRLKRSPPPRQGAKCAQSPPACNITRSPKEGTLKTKWSQKYFGAAPSSQSQMTKWGKPTPDANSRPGTKKVDGAEQQAPEQSSTQNQTNTTKDDGQGRPSQYIMVPLDVQAKEDRNPLSAEQALRDPVKTFKLGLAKAKDSGHSSKSQLKSPTRCANTATTSGNVGSLTRAEGDILVRQKSPNNRSRSPASLGSKIGSGAAKLLQNCKDDSQKNDEDGTKRTAESEDRRGDLAQPVKFRRNGNVTDDH